MRGIVGLLFCFSLLCCSFLGRAAVYPWEATEPLKSWQDFSDFGTWTLPALALGVALSKRDYEGMAQLTTGWGVAQLGTEGIKSWVPKARPNGVCCRSAASGHTSSAFSAAAYLHHRYGWNYGLPAYAYAGLTGLARVKANKHFPEDVLVGAVLGIGMSYLFTPQFTDGQQSIQVQATETPGGGVGVGILWPF